MQRAPDHRTPVPQASLLESIGDTPLLRLRRVVPEVAGAQLWAKAEWSNPGGSVKDRAALAIVRDAMRSGALRPGGELVDASSGNTGISYALLGVLLGFDVHLVVPENVGPERRALLSAYRARVTWTDPMLGMDGAIDAARELAKRQPQRRFYADQYSHDANWRAHYEGTGAEILRQTAGRLTHFVAGLGTTGTFVGTVRRLRAEGCAARAVACIPDSPYHGLEGLKHLPSSQAPRIWDPSLANEIMPVRTEDAYAMLRRLAAHEGLFVGPSSAAAVVAACRLIERDGPGTYVTVLPDSGLKYLSQTGLNFDVPVPAPVPARGPARGPTSERVDTPEGTRASGRAKASGDVRSATRSVASGGSVIGVPVDVEDAMRRAGEAAYPEECCGALLGRVELNERRVVESLPLDNARRTRRTRRFLIGPDEYRRAERQAEARGLTLIGFYHSHPDHPAQPSEYDRKHALPWHSYVILAVASGTALEWTSWVLRADRSRFDPEETARTAA